MPACRVHDFLRSLLRQFYAIRRSERLSVRIGRPSTVRDYPCVFMMTFVPTGHWPRPDRLRHLTPWRPDEKYRFGELYKDDHRPPHARIHLFTVTESGDPP